MLPWTILLLSLSVAPLSAAPAGAAELPFEGALGFSLGLRTGEASDPLVTQMGSGIATLNGSLGGVHLSTLAIPENAFGGRTTAPVFNLNPISGLVIAGGVTTDIFDPPGPVVITLSVPTGSLSHEAAIFSPVSGGPPGGGRMPPNGVLVVCLFSQCPLDFPAANVVVPLSVVGDGGTVTTINAIALTVRGAPWTLGTARIGSTTLMGFAHGPASLSSSTARVSGAVSLVTPVFISTSVNTVGVFPVFAQLTLHFVPEPGTFALLAVGVGLLGAAGRRRASDRARRLSSPRRGAARSRSPRGGRG